MFAPLRRKRAGANALQKVCKRDANEVQTQCKFKQSVKSVSKCQRKVSRKKCKLGANDPSNSVQTQCNCLRNACETTKLGANGTPL